MSAPVHVHQSFVCDRDCYGQIPNWLEGHVVRSTLPGLPHFVPLRGLPALLGGTVQYVPSARRITGTQIGWAFPEYLNAKSDAVAVLVELDHTLAGQCVVDMLVLHGPAPGTVMPVLTPDYELVAVAVTPGGKRTHAHLLGL
jgi:hypothetical protein